ncbi:MAG: hypothetical protein KKB30_07005 [Proteobacteria bacterium]|nr:hypothetical protein [Pseudomonadota bacterium]MBU1714179.1 hypothetical protein [Pseudomonadota bacterium]
MDLKQKIVGSVINSGWVPDEIGYQRTSSLAIIKLVLTKLQSDRRFITLVQKGYQSGNSILVDFDQTRLMIDKPVDWPEGSTKAMVVYRDDARLWNHFRVRVTATTHDTIYTDFPRELYQLQRRDHYRVDLPRTSIISFVHKNNLHQGFCVQDLSASGILIYRKKKDLLAVNDVISQITIKIPADEPQIGDPEAEGTIIKVSKAEVVRTFRNPRVHVFFFGIKFMLANKEEEIMLRYVRQRELELLRR